MTGRHSPQQRRIEPALDAKGRVIHWRCTVCRWTYPQLPGALPFKAPPQALQQYTAHHCTDHMASDAHAVPATVDLLPGPMRREVLHDSTFAAALRYLLDGAMKAVGASLGDLQLFDGSALELVAFHGFEASFGKHFRYVRPATDVAVSATAFRKRRREIVEDVFAHEAYGGLTRAAEDFGFAATVATPLFQEGALFGVVSAHFVTPYHPTEQELQRLDAHLSRAVPELLSLLRR